MDNLEHLLTLAKRGRYGGASGGEKRAYEIVACLAENVCGLDGRATDGITELITLLETQPAFTYDLLAKILGDD